MAQPEIGPYGFPTWEKDPQALKDYVFDWTPWLDGDTISTSVWTLPAGLTLSYEAKTATSTAAWISGGANGQRYTVSNKITTAGGRVEVRSLTLLVKPT